MFLGRRYKSRTQAGHWEWMHAVVGILGLLANVWTNLTLTETSISVHERFFRTYLSDDL